MNKKLYLIMYLAFIIFIIACNHAETPLNEVLVKAGNNRVELEKFLNHYPNDTLKHKAAKFLVLNMADKFTYDVLVKDSTNKKVNINLYQPEINSKNISLLFDSLNVQTKDTLFEDVKSIKAEFLIKNLEQAFNIWQTKPWAKNYTFEIFCEFILPYRIGTESLNNNWRNYFQNKYFPILDTLKGNKNVSKVFQLIKNDIGNWYSFAFNTVDLKPTQNFKETLSCGKGNCTDVANVYLYVLRAIGLAATIDYIPLWGRTNYGHCELVFFDENNQPMKLKTGNLLQTPPPKVYRQYYSNQASSLVEKVDDFYDIPPHLSDKSYFDVTSEYTNTSTVIVKPKKKPKNGILYLSVFNAGGWQPIAWSDSVLTKTEEFIFTNMGQNIVYLPSMYFQRKNTPNGAPFIIDNNGEIELLVPKNDSLISIAVSKDKINNELNYWDNKWVNTGKGSVKGDSLKFDNIP